MMSLNHSVNESRVLMMDSMSTYRIAMGSEVQR